MKATGKIDTKLRINNSINGNPRFEIIACIPGANCPVWIAGKTASDGQPSYSNFTAGDRVDITYHRTKTGNVIFDRITRS